MRRIKLVVLAVVVAALLALSAGSAVAAEWIQHPRTGGWVYCDYYGSEYWCQDEWGNWFPANPNWYNAAYNEMMRIFGQGVL